MQEGDVKHVHVQKSSTAKCGEISARSYTLSERIVYSGLQRSRPRPTACFPSMHAKSQLEGTKSYPRRAPSGNPSRVVDKHINSPGRTYVCACILMHTSKLCIEDLGPSLRFGFGFGFGWETVRVEREPCAWVCTSRKRKTI